MRPRRYRGRRARRMFSDRKNSLYVSKAMRRRSALHTVIWFIAVVWLMLIGLGVVLLGCLTHLGFVGQYNAMAASSVLVLSWCLVGLVAVNATRQMQ